MTLTEFSDTVFYMIDKAQQIHETVKMMKAFNTTYMQKLHFAQYAKNHLLSSKLPVLANQLLIPKRLHDYGKSLWTVYNVIQENVVKGGLMYYQKTDQGFTKRRTRPITALDRLVNVNRKLWDLSVELMS